ncbi:MAG: peptidoglycan DD-metalloendopeptidase family protein [Crocinitomicaceae bacterium]|nr:peptidoglycan DD-metalloendopeptidase family protein [Crocinitomicaceae bacterium]
MKNVINIVIFIFISLSVVAQSKSEKLKKEQQQLEKNIANTKLLLEKTKSNAASSFSELQLLNNQIAYREQLVQNFDNQIRGAELKIKEKQNQVEQLNEEMVALKNQYKNLLLYAYKHRNKYGKMMYIFSSDTYYEAIKRAKYLEKIQDLTKKQFLVIEQHKKLIDSEVKSIEKERLFKINMLDEKKQERKKIVLDQQKQQVVYQGLKDQEAQILAKLKEDERKKVNLKSQIDAAIRKEIADAEARRIKAEAEAKKKADATKPKAPETPTTADKPATTSTTTTPTAKPAVELPDTKESVALNKSFELNRGKLPWPVDKGTITEGYGKNPHPTIPGVFTNNNGVDISAPKNAQVKAVFEGEVTSVMNIPGSGKVIIIKHGNYRTVYSNLQSTFVNVGSKVSTKQVIGSLVNTDGSSISTSHFEIHQVVGQTVTSMNPSLWLNR